MTPTDVGLRSVTSEVAVAVVTLNAGDFTTPDGEVKTGTQDRLSIVLVKREGEWSIRHGHNTVIDLGAQRFDPVIAAGMVSGELVPEKATVRSGIIR